MRLTRKLFNEGRTLQSSLLRSVKPSIDSSSKSNNILEHPVAFSSTRASLNNYDIQGNGPYTNINNNNNNNSNYNNNIPHLSNNNLNNQNQNQNTHYHSNNHSYQNNNNNNNNSHNNIYHSNHSERPNFVQFSPNIKVIGVGGGGCNAVNNMIQRELVGVDFICANTDVQHLARTLTENRIQLGRDLTRGLGCGANPNQGRDAAEESREDIKHAVAGAQMIFITAGMGGGTGTGAAPVVAGICQELGILTVAVVTTPFNFEGKQRYRFAQEGIKALYDRVDTIIVIPNENLRKIDNGATKMQDAFSLSNDVLLAGVKNITDLMTKPGLINLDFADVRTIMSGMGNAIMGTGQCSGPEKAKTAARNALNNPLLGSDANVIRSAKGVLVNVTGGSDCSIEEVEEAVNTITSEILDEEANIIFGASIDPALEGAIRVSVVATGIDLPNSMLGKK